MSQAVRHRYEIMGLRPSEQYLRQQGRIKMDESIAARERENKLASDCRLKSDWKESAGEKASRQHLKTMQSEVSREMALARRASLMIRRAALQQQLHQECAQYERELWATDKAFYIKRT